MMHDAGYKMHDEIAAAAILKDPEINSGHGSGQALPRNFRCSIIRGRNSLAQRVMMGRFVFSDIHGIGVKKNLLLTRQKSFRERMQASAHSDAFSYRHEVN